MSVKISIYRTETETHSEWPSIRGGSPNGKWEKIVHILYPQRLN